MGDWQRRCGSSSAATMPFSASAATCAGPRSWPGPTPRPIWSSSFSRVSHCRRRCGCSCSSAGSSRTLCGVVTSLVVLGVAYAAIGAQGDVYPARPHRDHERDPQQHRPGRRSMARPSTSMGGWCSSPCPRAGRRGCCLGVRGDPGGGVRDWTTGAGSSRSSSPRRTRSPGSGIVPGWLDRVAPKRVPAHRRRSPRVRGSGSRSCSRFNSRRLSWRSSWRRPSRRRLFGGVAALNGGGRGPSPSGAFLIITAIMVLTSVVLVGAAPQALIVAQAAAGATKIHLARDGALKQPVVDHE